MIPVVPFGCAEASWRWQEGHPVTCPVVPTGCAEASWRRQEVSPGIVTARHGGLITTGQTDRKTYYWPTEIRDAQRRLQYLVTTRIYSGHAREPGGALRLRGDFVETS